MGRRVRRARARTRSQHPYRPARPQHPPCSRSRSRNAGSPLNTARAPHAAHVRRLAGCSARSRTGRSTLAGGLSAMTETCDATPRAGSVDALRPPAGEARLSVPGGWTVFHRKGPARTNIEIHDAGGYLVGLVASTRLPIASVDAGWRGFERAPDGGRRWWGLAIGHGGSTQASAVAFTRGSSQGRVRRQVVTLVIVDGLWVAAALG